MFLRYFSKRDKAYGILKVKDVHPAKWVLDVPCQFGLQPVVNGTPDRLEEGQRRRIGIDAGERTGIPEQDAARLVEVG